MEKKREIGTARGRKKCCERSREDGKEKGDKGRDLNRHERVSYTAEHEKKMETEARK